MTEPVRTFGTATANPDLIDPDLAPVELDSGSDLEDLRAELTAEVESATEPLVVPARPRYSVVYSTDVEGRELDAYRKRAKDRKRVDGIDGVRFASLLLANKCLAIHRNGEPLVLDGEVATFRHPELLELIGAAGAAEAVVKLYGRDGDVDAAARRVMTDAGWGDDAVDADPT